MNSARTLACATRVVLDTNTVLDLWAFCDGRVQGLRNALAAGQLDWLATLGMRQELETVLMRGVAAGHGAQAEVVLAQWDRHARVVEAPAPVAASRRLRCRDADDQPFLDLALAVRAPWLFSADRDLLSLAGRARSWGLQIRSAYGWIMPTVIDPELQG